MTDDDVLALYESSVVDVYRYATRLTGGDRALADELVQETYLGLLRLHRNGTAPEVDVGWLIVSCRHRFLDLVRRERRRLDRELRAAAPPSEQGGGQGAATDALARLTVDHRTVLVLRYVDALDVPEIARQIGRSVHATESLLSRARAALRDALGKGS
jgi:RNA polymerase sigma-70 factor, ECF subfamily